MHNMNWAIQNVNQDTHNNKPSYTLRKLMDPVQLCQNQLLKSQFLCHVVNKVRQGKSRLDYSYLDSQSLAKK